jgi:hypothetical protein
MEGYRDTNIGQIIWKETAIDSWHYGTYQRDVEIWDNPNDDGI